MENLIEQKESNLLLIEKQCGKYSYLAQLEFDKNDFSHLSIVKYRTLKPESKTYIQPTKIIIDLEGEEQIVGFLTSWHTFFDFVNKENDIDYNQSLKTYLIEKCN